MKRIRVSARGRTLRIVRNSAVIAVASLVAVQVTAAVAPSIANPLNKLAGIRLFVNPDAPARRQADAWRGSRPQDADLMMKIAAQPIANWIGDWNSDVRRDVANIVSRAAQ